MTIHTKETVRQLAYALAVAEELSDKLADCDDEEFNPVAYELAKGLVRRIRRACDTINAENEAIDNALNGFPEKMVRLLT